MRTRALVPVRWFVVLAAVAGCAGAGRLVNAPAAGSKASGSNIPAGSRAAATPVVDSALGFVNASVFSVPVPPRFHENAGGPGEQPRIARAYPGAPPRVPHGVADFLPITRAENLCLDCHDAARAPESGAVALPVSHYRDLRRAPEAARPQVAGTRYVCTSCHVPTSDAPPLVGSRFGTSTPPR